MTDAGTTPIEECPICGQPYQHKRETRGIGSGARLRSDATQCATAPVGDRQTVYVHLPAAKYRIEEDSE